MTREIIGYIGLGLMGRPVAENLLKAGYTVNIFARNKSVAANLEEAGATAFDSPSELASHCDVIFVNVPDTADVEEVVLGERGLIQGAKPGSLVIDMSTISPTATRRIAEQLALAGIDMLDAPVSGGTQGAQTATLSIMVGGKKDVLERVRPILNKVGTTIVHIGDHGAGQVAKACNQIIVAQTVAAIGEAFLLAESMDVDKQKVRDALMGGFAGSRVMEVHGQRLIDKDFEPGFRARLHDKDMNIVQTAANELRLSLPITEIVSEYIHRLVEQGDGELDSSALALVQKSDSGASD